MVVKGWDNMIIDDTHKCEFCGHDIMWAYQVPQKSSCYLFDVDTLPKDKVGLYRIGNTEERNGYKMPLDASVYCPQCNRLNSFKIKK